MHTERLVFCMISTRDYIIDEAFKLFLNHSYEAVSISLVSDAIGLTKGALYHHFKNKEELFMAVIDKHLAISGVLVDVENISLEGYINALIRHAQQVLKNMFKQNKRFIPINYLSLIADSFRHYKNFAAEKLVFVDKQIDELRVILDNAIRRGEIRNDIDTRIVSMQFFSLSTGMAGSFMKNDSITSALNSMKEQLYQLYHLLKK